MEVLIVMLRNLNTTMYTHSGNGSKQRWVGENDVQNIENLMHLQGQG